MRSLALITLLVPTLATAQPPPPPPGPGPVYSNEPIDHRRGMTFEANIGVGFMWAERDDGQESDKEVALGGINLGVGGWMSPRLALSLRVAGVTYTDSEGELDFRWTTGFLGPSAQYWLDDHFWLGGGVGAGVVALSVEGPGFEDSDSEVGLGLDLRAGYTFSTTSENTWNISFEMTPSFIEVDDTQFTFYGAAVLFGYQHL